MQILIAEDNRFYRQFLESTIREWDYEVIATGSGREAWEVLQGKDAPPIAVVDWMMPDLDGLELCRRVQALDRPRHPYLLMLTAKSGKENIIAALQGGADDYLVKPCDQGELHAWLQVARRIVTLQTNLAERVWELENALSVAQKMDLVGRLAGGVAHDFNNLLTVVTGYSDVLLRDIQPGDPRREAIESIKEAGVQGASLTRQLLAFARKQVLQPRVLDLNTSVAHTGKMLGRLIGENIVLTTDLEPRLYPVLADPGHVEQALMNLIVNARDAMPNGGRVTVTTRNSDLVASADPAARKAPPGYYAVLAVADTGHGMTPEVQARIFEPFFTTKGPGKGTGLGLATVYGIVRQTGGFIHVDSQPAKGTTFKIYLPRARGQAVPTNGRGSVSIVPGGRETVLVAEDDDRVRGLARTVLEAQGYAVLAARDGVEALKVGEQFDGQIDLLLTDLMMPGLGGDRLAARLGGSRPTMRVLLMSGYPGEEADSQGDALSSPPLLLKPFTPGELAARVREVLDGTQPLN